jgi:HAD superfamily hydrolase (TIGR01509 family)
MNKIQCIIFDMDGVLIDAREWHYQALNRALKIFGYEITMHDHLATYDGLPTMRKLEILSAYSNLPKQLHGFINELKQVFTMEIAVSECAPTFRHEYALSKLKNEGYRLAVCSNSVRDTVTAMLSKAAVINYFDFYLSNQDVNKPKPNPEIYLKAIQSFGVSPGECLVLEDNINGIKAATDAGAHVMQIHDISDVNYANISKFIKNLQSEHG